MYKLLSIFLGLVLLPFAVNAKEITGVDLLKAIETEFAEQGIANMVELEIFGGKTSFETDSDDVKILISNLKVDAENNKFTSMAEIFAAGKLVETTELLGRFFIMKEVYLPLNDIAKGEVIEMKDIKPVLIRENRLKDDTLIEADNIVGKQTVRLLKKDKLITIRDVRDEIVIKKGQEVTIIYKNKGLQITSKMEALEDGSKGSFIKFINTKSNKEIIAKVIDKNTSELKAE